MPRIKLTEQPLYELCYELQVRPQDINYGGHVGNDNLISLVGAARAHAFHCMGLSELDLGDGETGIVMTDLVVNYKSEAFLFDNLCIESHFGEFGKSSFRMFHRVRRAATTVGVVETGFVCFNYEEKRTRALPAGFLKHVSSLGSFEDRRC